MLSSWWCMQTVCFFPFRRHKCPHNRTNHLSQGNGPCTLTEYANVYKAHPLGARENFKPANQPVHGGEFQDKTTQRYTIYSLLITFVMLHLIHCVWHSYFPSILLHFSNSLASGSHEFLWEVMVHSDIYKKNVVGHWSSNKFYGIQGKMCAIIQRTKFSN